MGQCFLYGNGGSSLLAYDVVCQTTEPVKKEGRIWVKSSTAIVALYTGDKWGGAAVGTTVIPGTLGAPEPTASNSALIFASGSDGYQYNRIGGMPSVCLQVQGSAGSWKIVDAYVCHSDTWVQFSWTKRYLIQNGTANVDFVANAAYLSSQYTSYVPTAPTIAGKGGDGYYRIYQSGSSGVLKAGVVTTADIVPMGVYTKLCATIQTGALSGYAQSLCLWRTTKPKYAEDESIALVTLPTNNQGFQTKTISLTGISGDCYVGVINFCYGDTFSIWIKDLWLE